MTFGRSKITYQYSVLRGRRHFPAASLLLGLHRSSRLGAGPDAERIAAQDSIRYKGIMRWRLEQTAIAAFTSLLLVASQILPAPATNALRYASVIAEGSGESAPAPVSRKRADAPEGMFQSDPRLAPLQIARPFDETAATSLHPGFRAEIFHPPRALPA